MVHFVGRTRLIMRNPNLVLDFIFDLALVTSAVKYRLAKLSKKMFFRLFYFTPHRILDLSPSKKSLLNFSVTGEIVAGQFVTDNSLRTIRRMDNSLQWYNSVISLREQER